MKRRHHDLRVWQDAMELVETVYRVSSSFPDDERFGLTSQIRRASVSVASNIAEGAARGSDADFVRFLYMARGSLSEVETQLRVAERLGYVDSVEHVLIDIDRQFGALGALIKHKTASQ